MRNFFVFLCLFCDKCFSYYSQRAPNAVDTGAFFKSSNRSLRHHQQHHKQRVKPSCKIDKDEFLAYGKWASVTNVSKNGFSSLLSPLLKPSAYRAVLEEDLIRGYPVLSGSTECPDRPTDDPYDHDSLQDRSLCPWYWRLDYEPNRIPAVLPEAVCRCRRAVTGLSASYECQPVVVQVRVLQIMMSSSSPPDGDGCVHGEYELRTVKLTVACVAAVHNSRNVAKLPGIHETLPVVPPTEE